MKKMMFAIQKGGTGKTTTSGNVGYEISKNHKVVLIDFDPQGNLTSWLINDDIEVKYELTDFLMGKATIEEVLIERSQNLYILPTFGIGGSLRSYKKNELDSDMYVFQRLFSSLEEMGFDFAIADTSPALDNLEKRLMMEVDEVIAVVDNEGFSTDGLIIFQDSIDELQRKAPKPINYNKIVANKKRPLVIHKDNVSLYSEMEQEVFVIENLKDIIESTGLQQTLSEYNEENKNVPEYRRLASALVE